MCGVTAVANQKGGVAKTTTCVNLGVGLARLGKKVLLIDTDPQGSLTASLGYKDLDSIEITLATIMTDIIEDHEISPTKGILHHPEGIDLLPANIELAGIEVSLVNVMSREHILKRHIDALREHYDYIIIDCMPSLGMLTINSLVCADHVIIPVEAAYLPVKGLQQLIQTIGKIHRQLNPRLDIEGILITKVDERTNNTKNISAMLRNAYGQRVKIFPNNIPFSVRAAETSAEGISIFAHDPKGKVAPAYEKLAEEVISNEK